MASCANCGTTVLFGGVNVSGIRFCSKKCATASTYLQTANSIPDQNVMAEAMKLFNGPCPVCGGQGPVDLRSHHRVHSLIYLTQWKTKRMISCASCARKQQIGSMFYCLGLGWWGIPFGVVMTPVQIGRNIYELGKAHRDQPSEDLMRHVRLTMARYVPAPGAPTPYVRDPSAI